MQNEKSWEGLFGSKGMMSEVEQWPAQASMGWIFVFSERQSLTEQNACYMYRKLHSANVLIVI